MSGTTIEYSTSSEGKIINSHKLLWTVPKFLDVLDNTSTRVLQTDNLHDLKNDYRFKVMIQLLGRNKDIIEIYYLTPNPAHMEATLAARSYNGVRCIAKQQYRTVPGNKWQYLTTLIKKTNFVGYSHKNYQNSSCLSSDDSFKLEFLFNISVRDSENKDVNEPQICDVFENLLNIGSYSDATMKSVDGKEYKVHKGILAMRSPVLKAHFEHNTLECQTNIIESHLESEVLLEVLTFIYSDKAPRLDDLTAQLLSAADYYQLSTLKSLCEKALYLKLTMESSIEILQFAELHSAESLKQLTLEFIKDNHNKGSPITKTKGWIQLESVQLVKTISEYILNDDIESDNDSGSSDESSE